MRFKEHFHAFQVFFTLVVILFEFFTFSFTLFCLKKVRYLQKTNFHSKLKLYNIYSEIETP